MDTTGQARQMNFLLQKLCCSGLVPGILMLLSGAAAQAQDAARPNIILMMADDMGLGDTSAYQDFTGNSDQDQLHTPGMQQLANLGIRLTDAHTPSSRCSPTRYGLLTGRYPWRNRLKHWVLFGAQGDPMIEADRPTLATLLKDHGYRTGMVGKWHVGLRYRQTNGQPAAGFEDADLTQPLFDCPVDHGFDFSRITSRSHGTSGPEPGRRNQPQQTIGPGHIHGRTAVGATPGSRQLVSVGPNAYVLSELGGRHFDSATEFLNQHLSADSKQQPFFLYYACNSNHGPYTPDSEVGGQAVTGAGRTVSGEAVDQRGDFIFENDVALAGLLKYLNAHDDPRRPGHKLIDNTLVIFTSDNGAERDKQTATGPFRSHKGSVYEGGHRVPFLVAWPAGGIGDGDPETPGQTSQQLMGLQDVYATFAEILDAELPDPRAGEKGAEDSISVLSAWQGQALAARPIFFNDHKQADDHAACAIRIDNPMIQGQAVAGQWKLFLDARLLRQGQVHPLELYDLSQDSQEQHDRLQDPELTELVKFLSATALLHRTSGGHRLADLAQGRQRVTFNWQQSADSESNGTEAAETDSDTTGVPVSLAQRFADSHDAQISVQHENLTMTVAATDCPAGGPVFHVNPRGLGISAGSALDDADSSAAENQQQQFRQVDQGEALLIQFDQDVLVESAAIVAGNGQCGGFYQLTDDAPLAIYCIDADIDAQDQSGILSDIGVLKAGQTLRLDSSPHYGVETAGQWRLQSLTIRPLSAAVR